VRAARLFVVPAAQGAVVVEPKGRITHESDDGCRKQALDLVAGECDQPDRGGTAGVLPGTDDREEGVGEVTQRDHKVKQRTLWLVWKILSVRYRRPLTVFPKILENVTQLELYWSSA
jgi:hypothetical protein